MAKKDLAEERLCLLSTLQKLTKQDIDALYRLAEIETEEMQQIRVLMDAFKKKVKNTDDEHARLRRAAKELEKAASLLLRRLGETVEAGDMDKSGLGSDKHD